MKERAILPLVLTMSLPMVLSMLVSSLYNIVDSYFVAKISEDAMTALSLVFPVQNFINAVTIGFSIGVNAVISYFLGAQEQEKANSAASAGPVAQRHPWRDSDCGLHRSDACLPEDVYRRRAGHQPGPALLQHRLCLCRRHCPGYVL